MGGRKLKQLRKTAAYKGNKRISAVWDHCKNGLKFSRVIRTDEPGIVYKELKRRTKKDI